MEIRVLGPVQVVVEGGMVDLGAPRVQALLTILVLRAPEVVSADALVDGVWGDAPPVSARHLIQVYVSQLRQRLGRSFVNTQNAGYGADLSGHSLDAAAFERCLIDARSARAEDRAEDALALFDEALSWWRGPAAAGTALLGAASSLLARLDETRLAAREERIDVSLALGRYRDVLRDIEQLAGAEPLREHVWAQQMIALYRSGRQADSLAAYRNARRALSALGLEPGPELKAIERSVLQQDPKLLPGWAAQQEAPRPASPRNPTRRRRLTIWIASATAIGLVGAALAVLLPSSSRPRTLGALVPRNALTEIDASSGKLVGSTSLRSTPGAVSAGHAVIWVGDGSNRTLIGINPRTLQVTRTIGIGTVPYGIQAAGTVVWIANSFDGTITRVDANTGIVSRPQRPEPSSTGRLALEFGAGSLWVASQDDQLSRLNPETGRLITRLVHPSGPQSLAVGFGSIWIGQAAQAGIIRASESKPVARFVPIGGRAFSIATGAGDVWALTPANSELWRINPRNNAVTGKIHIDSPEAVAIAGGSVWVATGTRLLIRLDPQTLALNERLHLDGPYEGMAATANRIWITVG